ncbi:hypothetical protein BDV18DRAFT_143592 [Aspergillus unguis]
MKPPLPFPLALNIGTDIVHLPRITRLVTRPGGYLTRFTRRILTESEQRDFRVRFSLPEPNPNPDTNLKSSIRKGQSQSGDTNGNSFRVTPEMARWLAGRFAAKEAGRKAAVGGAGVVGWKDVVVRARVPDENGSVRPDVVLYDGGDIGAAGETERQGRVGRLSISHDGEYVVATVLVAG